MPGSRALRKLQLGDEGTAGTPVAASAIWRGMGVIKDQRETVFVEEDVGILGGTTRSYVPRIWSELNMPAVPATFEQLPYLFEAGVAKESPTQDGAGSDYIYNYLSPTTAQNTIQTYTIEGGDDQQAEEFDYAFVQNIVLAGAAAEALTMSADWYGRATTNTTFTGAIAIPTVEEIMVSKATLYIDNSGGSVGGTAVSSTLREIELSIATGIQPYWTVNASTEFTQTKFVNDEILLRLVYEHNASAVTEKGKWRTGDIRLIRLLFEGTAVATAGTTYTYKTMIWDLAGKYEDFEALDERDGNDVVACTFRVRYSVADTLKADFTIVNELSALP